MVNSLLIKAIKKPSLAFYRVKRKIGNEIEDFIRFYLQKPIWNRDVNEKEIRIAGLRRTGNHAVTTWIKEQIEDYWYINNINAKENPFRYKYQNLSRYFPQHKWTIEHYKKEAKILTPKKYLLYSYEDYPLSEIFHQDFEKKHDLYLGKSKKRYDLLILRDPFNLFASRFKKDMMNVHDPNGDFVEYWLDYAKEFLGETNYLKHNKICINYNIWNKDRDYREEIALKLGLEFTDKGFNTVSKAAGGSSFDGQNLNGKANLMDVDNRWKHFINNPLYIKIFENQAILEYSEKIFGHIPETEALLMAKKI